MFLATSKKEGSATLAKFHNFIVSKFLEFTRDWGKTLTHSKNHREKAVLGSFMKNPSLDGWRIKFSLFLVKTYNEAQN